MPNYTVEQLMDEGPPFAMAMLLRSLEAGESFITYGAIREELQYQLGIEKIFPTQIGQVAGALMNLILEISPNAPLINALITRPNGLPGVGVGGYFAKRYSNKNYNNWQNVSDKTKQKLIDRERQKVLRYGSWNELNTKLFGSETKSKLRKPIYTEVDGSTNNGKRWGGEAESNEHKRLKEWTALNPNKIGLKKSFGEGEKEHSLLSGDEVDVLFSEGINFVTVEVKSCRSNDEDFRRGIYQCVKYKKIKEAEHYPNKVNVEAILVTERELNTELKTRARLLKVKFKCVSVND